MKNMISVPDNGQLEMSFYIRGVLIFAVPFHILLIIVLVRYRKSDVFSYPFFYMLFSLTVNDLLSALILSLSSIILYYFDKTSLPFNSSFLYGLYRGITSAGIAGDAAILVAIGINRLVSYVFPLHALWSHPFHTKLAILIQWCYAGSMALFFIHPDLHGSYSFNTTTGVTTMSYGLNELFKIRAIIDTVVGCTAGLALAILYCISVGCLVYRKITAGSEQESQSLIVEARLTIQGFVLSSTLIMVEVLYGYVTIKRFDVPMSFVIFLFTVHSSNFFFGPFIAIVMSSVIREHIKKLFTSNHNVIHVLPNNAVNNH